MPIKADGYDVLMATEMLDYIELSDNQGIEQALAVFDDSTILPTAKNALKNCVELAEQNNLFVKTQEIKLGTYIMNPEKAKVYGGYSGFGGIPDFITLNLFPNVYILTRIPALVAHEFHHNLRFSYFKWAHGDVAVDDYLVIEVLAESFAKELYGEKLLGPWVTSMDQDDLDYSIEVIGEALGVKGFAEVASFMFGNEISRAQGYQPVGLSFCAGYAVGYEVVQSFLKNSGKTIYEATLLGSEKIIRGSGVF